MQEPFEAEPPEFTDEVFVAQRIDPFPGLAFVVPGVQSPDCFVSTCAQPVPGRQGPSSNW